MGWRLTRRGLTRTTTVGAARLEEGLERELLLTRSWRGVVSRDRVELLQWTRGIPTLRTLDGYNFVRLTGALVDHGGGSGVAVWPVPRASHLAFVGVVGGTLLIGAVASPRAEGPGPIAVVLLLGLVTSVLWAGFSAVALGGLELAVRRVEAASATEG